MALSPAFIADKDELLTLVNSRYCRYTRLVEASNSYDALFEQLDFLSEDFNCLPDYLKEILALFTDTVLTTQKVYYNKSGNITNPTFVVGGTLGDIIIEENKDAVYIHSGVIADRLIIRNNVTVDYILVSGGSKIGKIEIEEGSIVKYLAVKNCQVLETEIGNISRDCYISGIKSIYVQPMVAPPPTINTEIVGKSAYQLWLDLGNTGTLDDFMESLKGEQGEPGVDGEDGIDGAGAPASYTHTQSVAASVWTVNHNLGFKPGGVYVEDNVGNQWLGDVTHINDNSLTIDFGASSVAGTAVCS